MKCPQCDRDNPPASKFCSSCGTRLPLVCAGCGHHNPGGARFCNGCGVSLVAETARFGAPDSYTPEALADRMRTSGAVLEGERKQVTVLFADLKGSMELLAGRDPEEARQVLDPVLERMIEAVHRYEGTVNQVMGDGIMAIFGAPLAHEDHAVRACYAALAMQHAIESYAHDAAGRGVELKIRVGLNSGEVVVRSIGSDLRMDYSAIGQTTHLAARMEQLAPAATILMTSHTARLAEGHVTVEPRGPVDVKGLHFPVDTYALTATAPIRSRLQVAAARGLTRFIGRATQMTELAQAMQKAAQGHGQVVAAIGEPGAGKSRVVWEFVAVARAQGWQVFDTYAAPYGKHVAYLPLIGLLKMAFGITDEDHGTAIRSKIRRHLGADAAARFVAPLLAVLGVPPGDARWEALDPDHRRRRILESFKHLVVDESQRRPLCIVVEDLHWIDGETQAVLDSLVDSVATARLLLLVTFRPEYQHAWGNRTYYAQVAIDPLPRDSAIELATALVGGDAGLHGLRDLLVDRTDGNPFFLEESVRNLVETGVLAGGRAAYRLAKAPDRTEVPDTVHAVLAARIDRLAPSDKRILQAASAVGKDVPLTVLRSIVDVSEDELGVILTRLQAGEFLYEVRLFPEVEYTFRHALTLDVTFGSLLRERRRALDGRIVGALEQLHREPSGEALTRVAHHALRGEVWDKAFVYCRQAGAREFARSAHRAAATYFDHALAALEHLPALPDRAEHAIDLRLDLRYALSPLGEYRRMREVLMEAEALADKLGDRRRLARVSAFLTNFFTLRGDFDHAITYGERALSLTDPADVELAAPTNNFLSLAFFGKGDYRRAAELTARSAGLVGQAHAGERFGMAQLASVYSRTVMAWSLAELGEFDRGQAAGEEGLRIAEAAEHPHSVIFACVGLGTLYLRRGECERAASILERAYVAWQATDLPAVLLELAAPLAAAYGECGRVSDALSLLEHAVSQAVLLRHRVGHWLRTGGFAEAHLRAGNVEEALPLAQMFVEIARMVHARGSEAWALHLLGDIHSRRDPVDEPPAEAALAAAIAIAGELGMRPLQARCLLTRGLLRHRTARSAEAHDDLAAAAQALRALGMTAWAERADAAERR
jgi:class 3 adenylate cyclase/tetratricopeptide (TPR) repeat protein